MQPAGATVDPFSIICHSGLTSASEQTPANQTPTKACDHCSLCFVAGALAGPDVIPAGYLDAAVCVAGSDAGLERSARAFRRRA